MSTMTIERMSQIFSAEIEQYAKKAYKGELTPSLFDDSGDKSWDESKHPRVEKGSTTDHGGQFTSEQGSSDDPSPGSKKADDKPEHDLEAMAKEAVESDKNIWEHARSKGLKMADMTSEQRNRYADHAQAHRDSINKKKSEPSKARADAQAKFLERNKPDGIEMPSKDLSASDRDAWMKQQAFDAIKHINQADEARASLGKILQGKSGAWWSKLDGMNRQEIMKAKDWMAKYPPKHAGTSSVDYEERDARDEALRLAGIVKDSNQASGVIQSKIHPAEFAKWESLLEENSKQSIKPSGISMPSKEIPNEQAKPGDQLGLFGDATKAKKPLFKPQILEGMTKAKQAGLFDTKGNADQMDLFGDGGVMPDELVYKPKSDDSKPKKREQTYLKGDLAEHTGKVTPDGFHEVEMMEGHSKGQMKVVPYAPGKEKEFTDKRAAEKQAEFKDQQEQFGRLQKKSDEVASKTVSRAKTDLDFGEKIEVRKHTARATGPRTKKELTDEEKARFIERYANGNDQSQYSAESDDLYYDENRGQQISDIYSALADAFLVDRYDWNEQLHPRGQKGNTNGGRFTSKGNSGGTAISSSPGSKSGQQAQSTIPSPAVSTKSRTLAAAPDIQSHHSLHIKNQSSANNILLNDYRKSFNNIWRTASAKAGVEWTDANAEEQIWKHVDKNQLTGLLNQINAKDKTQRAAGGPGISDAMNYNQVIPKHFAERLHGGSRFFDPEKLRGKWNEPAPAPKPESIGQLPGQQNPGEAKQPGKGFTPQILGKKTPEGIEKVSNDEFISGNWDMAHSGLASENVQSKIAKGMEGIENREYAIREQSVGKWQMISRPKSTPAPIRSLEGKKSQASPQPELPVQENPGEIQPPKVNPVADELSPQTRNMVNKAISELISPDPHIIEAFRPILISAWKQKRDAVNEHNQAFRQIVGTTTPQSMSALVRQARNNTLDPATKKNFDIMVHSAESGPFGHLLQGRGKDGLLDLLSEGIKQEPNIMDEDVAELAVSMAGPSFFGDHDPGDAPYQDETDWSKVGEMENAPFSWLSAAALIDQYRQHARIVRYSHESPTPAQLAAGNFRKKHVRIQGMEIAIETEKGKRRKPEWPRMSCDYGYIKGARTRGPDGDHIDVFVGPSPGSELVYVIDQVSQNGKFDECKAFVGFTSKQQAVEAYKKCYTSSWRVGKVTTMTVGQFKAWLEHGNQKKAIEHQISRYSRANSSINFAKPVDKVEL